MAAIALHKTLNASSTTTTTVPVNVQCNRTCTYCESNGTIVMPWGGQSEQQFSTNTIGVGPLFASLNTVNYTGYNVCSTGLGDPIDSDDDLQDSLSSHHHHHHHRRKRFIGYGDDYSWRLVRTSPPGYSIAGGDNALAASLEVDGSGFVIGNTTATCGGYIGCESVSPVGNFTVLYTYNTSGHVYFQVYPAIYALRQQLVNLTGNVAGLNITALALNISYLTAQVNLLWIAVDDITLIIDSDAAEIANISATFVLLINETNALSNFVYGVLNVTVSQLETNLTLVSAVANAAAACCSATNTTLSGLIANVTALQVHMVLVDAQIAALQGNVTLLQQQVAVLQGNVTTMQTEIVTLQGNVSTLVNTTAVVQANMSALSNTTNTLQQQFANLSGCCTSNGTQYTMGAVVASNINGSTITGSTLHLAYADATTRGVVFGYTSDDVSATFNANVGYHTPTSTSGTGNTALGLFSIGTLSAGNYNTAVNGLGQDQTSQGDVGIGNNAGVHHDFGADGIFLGVNTVPSTTTSSNEYIFGAGIDPAILSGHGSDSYTLDVNSILPASNPVLQITATGQLTQPVSSMIYKNPLPDPAQSSFAPYIEQLVPRAFSYKDDRTNRTRVGYYAEEMEAIENNATNATVFDPILNYRLVDDTSQPLQPTLVWTVDPTNGQAIQQEKQVYPKMQVVDGIDYSMLVVYITSYLQWLELRTAQVEQSTGLTPPSLDSSPTPTPTSTPTPP